MKSWNLRTPDGIIKSVEQLGIELGLEAIGVGGTEEQLGGLEVSSSGIPPSPSSSFSKGKVSKKLGPSRKITSSASAE
ncbi:MAG: hypothetical protein U1A05_04855, partial [Alphaproteobacteria bacterium]|nr:hypothetical protein [Alphaproteobacteria bacterium]